ncbi:MAG: HAD-IA family hydrolase [Gammaproteobacteria bacterium]|nr:HAD-IA family hydrolase [Gammaproteobacteria bacterium]
MNTGSKLIIFDWDGTLMDSEAQIVNCLRDAIADLQFAERTDDQMKNIIGLGLAEAFSVLYPEGSPVEYKALIDRYRYHFLEVNKTPAMLFDGVEDMLQELSAQGHYLAVATGKGRAGLDKVLRETGMAEHFHVSRCADECFSKPHPQMLLEIMDFVGVDAKDALMIGDTEYDLQMANNAGVKSLAVSYGVHEKQRLLQHQPLDMVDDIAALRTWLQLNYTAA